jgi:hypothetical protein
MQAAREAGIPCRASTVEAAHPWEAICNCAGQHGCVPHRHGLARQARPAALLHRSETPKVLAHCAVPVLVVR